MATTTTTTATQETATKKPEQRFFMSLEGIRGTATEPGYEGWIPLRTAQFGIGLAISGRRRNRNQQTKKKEDDDAELAGAGDIVIEEDETTEEAFLRRVRASGIETSEPSISEISVTKLVDATSPQIFHLLASRRPLRRAIIEHVYDRTTLRFTLESVFISSDVVSGENDPKDGEPQQESLSLNFQQFELSVVDKVRRPLALPGADSFASFDPHRHETGALPLPLELVTRTLAHLDQTSLVHAAMADKRMSFAASDDLLKVYEAHSTSYDINTHAVSLDGRPSEPFWPSTSA